MQPSAFDLDADEKDEQLPESGQTEPENRNVH